MRCFNSFSLSCFWNWRGGNEPLKKIKNKKLIGSVLSITTRIVVVAEILPPSGKRIYTLVSCFDSPQTSHQAPGAVPGASEVMDYSWDVGRDDMVPLCRSYASKRDRTGCIRSAEKAVTCPEFMVGNDGKPESLWSKTILKLWLWCMTGNVSIQLMTCSPS